MYLATGETAMEIKKKMSKPRGMKEQRSSNSTEENDNYRGELNMDL